MKSLLAISIPAQISCVTSKCPSGMMQGLNAQECYHFTGRPSIWSRSEKVCAWRNGRLASVSSAMTNVMLRKIGSLGGEKELWLGGSFERRQWSWTDGFSYNNWAAVARVASKCPSGTMQGLNDQDCYHFEAVPAMWLKAEEDCIGRKGHLTSVFSSITNAMLRKISSLACAKEFWLGGSWDTESPQQWSWTDGRRFSYTNWASGQPINQEHYCTALDGSSGSWYSRACNTAKPFICKVPPVNSPVGTTTTDTTVQSATTTSGSTPAIGFCRDGWTYVAAAGRKCLRITDSADTWSSTWAECKKLGGDLVSIPNNATNYAIRDFACIQAGIGVDTVAYFAIGLYGASVEGVPWQWTDGSPVTYTNWQIGAGRGAGFSFLGVFGQTTYNVHAFDAHWEEFTPDDQLWQGICQSDRL